VIVQNLLMPGDELGFRVDFKQPYVFGGADTKKTALSLSAFNVRKISGVFIPGAEVLVALGFWGFEAEGAFDFLSGHDDVALPWWYRASAQL
jgi:hypothetical protein